MIPSYVLQALKSNVQIIAKESPFEIRVYHATSSADADTFIGTLSFDLSLNPIYQALVWISNKLYDACAALTESLAGQLPFRLVIPSTRITFELFDATGTPKDFRLGSVTLDPITVAKKFYFLGEYWVAYPVFNEQKIVGSEVLWYTVEGVYQQGTSWEPDHQFSDVEMYTDILIISIVLYIIKWLSSLGVNSIAQNFAARTFSLQTSWSIKDKIGDAIDDIAGVKTTVDTINGLVSGASGLANIYAKVVEAIALVDENSSVMDKLKEIQARIGVKLSLAI